VTESLWWYNLQREDFGSYFEVSWISVSRHLMQSVSRPLFTAAPGSVGFPTQEPEALVFPTPIDLPAFVPLFGTRVFCSRFPDPFSPDVPEQSVFRHKNQMLSVFRHLSGFRHFLPRFGTKVCSLPFSGPFSSQSRPF
jgi:hypothetical protein